MFLKEQIKTTIQAASPWDLSSHYKNDNSRKKENQLNSLNNNNNAIK